MAIARHFQAMCKDVAGGFGHFQVIVVLVYMSLHYRTLDSLASSVFDIVARKSNDVPSTRHTVDDELKSSQTDRLEDLDLTISTTLALD